MKRPITFPGRPRQGGPLPEATEAGGYPAETDVSFEPKFNGWRVLVHVPTGTAFNRHGAPLTITEEFAVALEKLKGQAESVMEWIDCEGLERRHAIGQGTLVVIDWVDPDESAYRERRSVLELMFPLAEVGAEQSFPGDSVLLMPRFTLDEVVPLWDRLQTINASLGCIFYEGVIAKRNWSRYPVQLRSSSEEFSGWVKHRFTTK